MQDHATTFETQDLLNEARFEMWRTVTAPFFSFSPTAPVQDGFEANVEICAVSDIMVCDSASSAQVFRRSTPHLGLSAWDHVLVQLYVEGGYVGDVAGAEIKVRAGDICVLDLSQSLHTQATAFRNVTVAMPRRLVAQSQSVFYHGRVIAREHPMAPLIAMHLKFLSENAGQLGVEEVEAGVAALIPLFEGTQDRAGQSDRRAAQLATAREQVVRYIDLHLTSSDLSPDALALACNMSRATLYRLTALAGGVQGLVQNRKLERAWDMLSRAKSRLTLEEVAFACGFSTAAHFSRLFKQSYGISPSGLRAMVQRGETVEGLRKGKQASEWLTTLRDAHQRLQFTSF